MHVFGHLWCLYARQRALPAARPRFRLQRAWFAVFALN